MFSKTLKDDHKNTMYELPEQQMSNLMGVIMLNRPYAIDACPKLDADAIYVVHTLQTPM